MPEVSPITGEPIIRDAEEKRRQHQLEEQKKDKEKLLDAFSIRSELQSKEGMRLVQIMRENLERRIEKLIHEDQECKAIISILDQIGLKLNWSSGTAKKVIERTLNIVSPA